MTPELILGLVIGFCLGVLWMALGEPRITHWWQQRRLLRYHARRAIRVRVDDR